MSAQILYSCILHKISWGCSRGTESNFTAVRRHTELLSFCIFFDQLPTHVDISPLSGLKKYAKKKNFSQLLFLKSTLSVLRCTWTGQINLKIFLGYDINYLSIWPFMCHPWFPTRKASKLRFWQGQMLRQLIFSDLSGLSMCISKRIKWI